jgi:hypothetical protein
VTTEAASGLVDGGDNTQVVYHQAVPSDSMLAGRSAQPRG